MRHFALLATLLAGCDARGGAETAVAFLVLFGTLVRLFADPETR